MYVRIYDSLYSFVDFKYIEDLLDFETFVLECIQSYRKSNWSRQVELNTYLSRRLSEYERDGMAHEEHEGLRNRLIAQAGREGIRGWDKSLSIDVGNTCYIYIELQTVPIEGRGRCVDFEGIWEKAIKKAKELAF